MDGWQAVQNWSIFGVVAAGLVYYYYPKEKKANKPAPAPVQEVKKQTKKAANKVEAKVPPVKSDQVSNTDAGADSNAAPQNGAKKRKATFQSTPQSSATPVAEDKQEPDEIDMSTRQFALSMQKARAGIKVQSADSKQTRVKTVKAKNTSVNAHDVSSSSSQADAEDDWTPAATPAARAAGIDDMLEPKAPGPAAIRITGSEKPAREKATKPAKKEEAMTKKQRQNRKKAQQQSEARQEELAQQEKLKEQQRRTARESRGEPAKNGNPIAAAPVHNPWEQKNAARDAHLPAVTSQGNHVQLLDTLDTESNSSSNHDISTAATSMTDAAPSRWADDVASGEDDLAKAVEESERDSGWSEVKTNKKQQKKARAQPNDPPAPATAKSTNTAPSSKLVGFQALNDEYEQTAGIDANDPSAWAA